MTLREQAEALVRYCRDHKSTIAQRDAIEAALVQHVESRQLAEAELAKLRAERDEALQLAGGPSTFKELADSAFDDHQEVWRLREALAKWRAADSPPGCEACAVLEANLPT